MAYPDYKDQIQITREQALKYYNESGYSGTNIVDILTNTKIIMEGTLRYIGTKIIDAKPMALGEYNDHRGWVIPANEDPFRDGYLVVYPDGYQSWSPKDAFEQAYRPTLHMNFGLALEAMKKGKKVTRGGWNGKDMFIYWQGSSSISFDQIRNPVLKGYWEQFEKTPIFICGHIDMKAADGTIVIGWLASQTDMLSDDWEIVD